MTTHKGSGADDSYAVVWGEGGQHRGTITITGRELQTIVLDRGGYRETHMFMALVSDARQKALPGWVEACPPLMARIEAIFSRERREGKDPHTRLVITSDEVRFENLGAGTAFSMSIRELQRMLRQGERIPPVFDRPEVYARVKA
jgi:hypothetical protein